MQIYVYNAAMHWKVSEEAWLSQCMGVRCFIPTSFPFLAHHMCLLFPTQHLHAFRTFNYKANGFNGTQIVPAQAIDANVIVWSSSTDRRFYHASTLQWTPFREPWSNIFFK